MDTYESDQKYAGACGGWIELFAGMGGDGSESVRGRVGMGVKSAGMGGDGTKIPSPCTPLLCCMLLVTSNEHEDWIRPLYWVHVPLKFPFPLGIWAYIYYMKWFLGFT